MAVRLASDTIRTLYAIQCITKDMKRRSQSPVYKHGTPELYKIEDDRPMSTKSSAHSVPLKSQMRTQKQNFKRSNITKETALVHKVHPNDRPLRNNVPERTKCRELDDILAKWNVYKPEK